MIPRCELVISFNNALRRKMQIPRLTPVMMKR